MTPARFAFLASLVVVCFSSARAEEVAATTTEETPVECTYGNRTYKEGETIVTENVCLHCACRQGWTAPSSTSCAIIDCPWGFYRLRPYCVQRYVTGQCCPELTCGPPPPQLDPSYLSGKRATLTTDNYIIMAQEGSEVMIYCVIDNPNNATVEVEWTKRGKDGQDVPLHGVSKAVNDSYDNAAWGLFLETVHEEDAGVYTCHIGTTPPQTQKTELKFFSRPSFVEPECLQPPSVEVPPENVQCSINASQWGYYYDGDAWNCVKHTPQCGKPPANNFATKEECWNRCSDACYKSQDQGFCEVHMERYYYSHDRDTCQRFTYNGCQGNRNNFRTHNECLSACSSVRFLHLEGKEGPEEEVPSDKRQPLHCPPCAWKHWIHYLVKGCRPELEENACCPTRFDCSDAAQKPAASENVAQAERESHRCIHQGKNYTQGEDILLDEECQVCTCNKNFKGPGSFGCRPLIKCNEDEIKAKMADGCVPVYEEGACCPADWQCPLKEISYRQTGPEVFYKEPPELQCSYGGRLYPRWYSLITGHGFCRSCVCLTPPDFSCVNTVCPPHPSALNDTVRCETEPGMGDCCPEYKCWDITKEPDHVGKPQTAKEKEFCDNNPCEPNQKCEVNYTACHQGECNRNCEPCPSPACSRNSIGIYTPPYECPICQSFRTPEEACANYDGCSSFQTCVVDEEKCRHGECEPMCQRQELLFMITERSNITADDQPVPCASVTCASTCIASPPNDQGCSATCICPNTPEEACNKYKCPEGTTCQADCSSGSCDTSCKIDN